VTTLKELADQLEDLLPQTQCTKCGYPACRPYAEAIASGSANFNQCPPGGHEGIVRLAGLLGRPVLSLNPENGQERPRPVAVIDENLCIGCTLCIQACPVDAIIGAPKQMHTVIAELCTGCDLCVAPCPVDCIAMIPVTGTATGWDAWSQEQADAARLRHDRHRARLTRLEQQRHARTARSEAKGDPVDTAKVSDKVMGQSTGQSTLDSTSQRPIDPPTDAAAEAAQAKRAIIEAALQRARAKKTEAAAAGQTPRNVGAVSPAMQAQIDAADARRRRLGLEDEPEKSEQPKSADSSMPHRPPSGDDA
jgi:electron transport complex protein RnfB